MMVAHSIDSVQADSQRVVQGEAIQRIFDSLGIKDRIERMSAEYAESVLPYSGDMVSAKKQAKRWICEALIDLISAEANYEVMLLD
jgi:hypothetical protein